MYYFVSDIHLGGGTPEEARSAERRFVEWLDRVGERGAKAIFICGDLFDFWFEYKRVIPKGFVRTLGRLAQLTDRGVRVVLMTGNHDQWVRDYFESECGVEVYTSPRVFEVAGKRLYLAHGDNLNVKRDPLLKLMNRCFRSSFVRTLFSSLVHPDLALKFGQWWSLSSRRKHVNANFKGQGHAIESLVEYASMIHDTQRADYYIFGHLHIILDTPIADGEARVIITNDWAEDPHCAVMDDSAEITIMEI